MANLKYLPRLIDNQLIEYLENFGAVSIQGPKWCGKTRTAQEFSKSAIYIDNNPSLLDALSINPQIALSGPTPHLIDEWQLVPSLWDAVRREVDQRGVFGEFILTGSTTPPKNSGRHSGAGRYGFLRMHTMSLYESKESDGAISLSALFAGHILSGSTSELTVPDMAAVVTRGGWPNIVEQKGPANSKISTSYLQAIIKSDLHMHEGPRRSPEKLRLFLQTLARNSATATKISTMISDISERAGAISNGTAHSYLNDLKEQFIIDEQPSWNVSLISKATLRVAPKRHFTDPCLAAAALSATNERLLQDTDTLGRLFESLCFRDCTIYAQALGGSVYQYHDTNELEVDIIIVLNDGRWGALEVKLGTQYFDKAVRNLTKLAQTVDKESVGAPSFLGILYAGQYGYTRTDGIHVIPIGNLGP